ncbi:group II truncated hemoglobin [Corallincola spongiicola]|uniref:Hemoglobin-like oxygen-binding protein n=1 Tax=Corallincola spongiicola TaxID=2520508 RepID=A0ABY1WL99_9GAMM|nr:group II truncated hemoglobin [Corallincola spongiicola]TAA41118.1 hemoglobin-like oxygen-binding protein [Corallincola spongiicola]
MIRKLFRIGDKSSSTRTHPTPEQSPYQLMGGEIAVKRLANRFYDIMETAPEAAELLAIHPMPLDSIRERFFEFLSGWLGGPGLFEEKYGHPRLRARHLPFKIDKQMRDQWMFCMGKALDIEIDTPLLREQLRLSFASLADHMRNQPEV